MTPSCVVCYQSKGSIHIVPRWQTWLPHVWCDSHFTVYQSKGSIHILPRWHTWLPHVWCATRAKVAFISYPDDTHDSLMCGVTVTSLSTTAKVAFISYPDDRRDSLMCGVTVTSLSTRAKVAFISYPDDRHDSLMCDVLPEQRYHSYRTQMTDMTPSCVVCYQSKGSIHIVPRWQSSCWWRERHQFWHPICTCHVCNHVNCSMVWTG